MKIWQRKLALALVLVMVFMCASPAVASTVEERIKYLYDKVDEFSVLGVYSDNEVYSLWIDLNQISDSGTVVTYTYKNGIKMPQIGSFNTTPRSIDSAKDKLTRYILGNIANTYRQSPFNTEMTMKTYKLTTVPTYVYGDYKNEAINEILLGLPDCFYITYDTSSGRSTPTKPIKMPIAEQTIKAIFALNSTSYSVNDETKTMDTEPIIKDERTFVPVRYLAYALGATEDDITWDGATQTVTVKINETTEILTLGSDVMLVNNEPVKMDVAPFANKGRTFLPARWIAEPVGAQVEYNPETKQVIIELIKKQGQ